MSYPAQFNTCVTPQSKPIARTVPNSAGGYAFAVDPWTQFDRFLILGSEGGTYYANEQTLTVENARNVQACITADGARAVMRIVSISDEGRAPKNDPALFALALAASAEDPQTRALALAALPNVARIGTHLFHFLTYVQQFRGWGRSLREAVGSWYTQRKPENLAQQLLKYQSRDGWTHRDVLRLAHVAPQNGAQAALFQYAVKGTFPTNAGTHMAAAWAVAADELLHTTDVTRAVQLITQYQLPREVVPTGMLQQAAVWEALLPHMGITAVIRNLGKLTQVGLLAPLSSATQQVTALLRSSEALQAGRVHPIQLLSALLTYRQGHGVRGSLLWNPVGAVTDAVEAGFYASFGNLTPTGQRYLLGLDVSGSMGSGQIAGVPGLTPRVGAAVMAMVTARLESQYEIRGFAKTFMNLNIAASDSLETVVRKVHRNDFGSTDCSLPMQYALQEKIPVDVFAVYTDSETWAGSVHPVQALRQYRERTGIPAKLVVVSMMSNAFSIADPQDTGMLDVVGFDTATPQILADFARGTL